MSSQHKYTWFRLGAIVAAFAALSACDRGGAPPPQTPRVTYMTAQENTVPLLTELPGRVSAYQVSEVRPQVSGIIQKRFFEEGSNVRQGQQLYQIDPALFQATYNSARADLARAQANVKSARLLAERYGKIVDINAVSRQEYDDAIAARDQAEAAVQVAQQTMETARINLEYTKVLAPISGRISRSFVTPGALVTQNQADPLTTVQQLTPVYVDVTQSSAELLNLRRSLASGEVQTETRKGTKIKLMLEDGTPYVRLRSDSAEPEWVYGELQFSDVTVDQSTGAFTVRATFPNPDNLLLPGMYVRAVIEEGLRPNTILVPQKTVMRDTKNQPYVYVLSKNKPAAPAGQQQAASAAASAEPVVLGADDYYVEQRFVTIDRDYDNNWLVTSGLRTGEKVIDEGLQKVRPGQVVTGEAVAPAGRAAAKPVAAETGAVIEQPVEKVETLPLEKEMSANENKAAAAQTEKSAFPPVQKAAVSPADKSQAAAEQKPAAVETAQPAAASSKAGNPADTKKAEAKQPSSQKTAKLTMVEGHAPDSTAKKKGSDDLGGAEMKKPTKDLIVIEPATRTETEVTTTVTTTETVIQTELKPGQGQ